MHRIGRISLSLLAAACLGAPALAEDPATPEQAIARLLGQGLSHSHGRLRVKFTFQPFALVLRKGGAIEQLGGHSGDELDVQQDDRLFRDPTKVLADLQQQVATEVKTKGDVVAVGFFSAAEIKLPSGRDSDAIQADLETAGGSCTTVFEPYQWIDDETPGFDAQIRTKRKGTIFPCP